MMVLIMTTIIMKVMIVMLKMMIIIIKMTCILVSYIVMKDTSRGGFIYIVTMHLITYYIVRWVISSLSLSEFPITM